MKSQNKVHDDYSIRYLRISYFGTIINSNATMQRLAYASTKCAYD